MTTNKYCIILLDKKRGWPSHLPPWTISSEDICKSLARKEAIAEVINWHAGDSGLSTDGSETVISNLRYFK